MGSLGESNGSLLLCVTGWHCRSRVPIDVGTARGSQVLKDIREQIELSETENKNGINGEHEKYELK